LIQKTGVHGEYHRRYQSGKSAVVNRRRTDKTMDLRERKKEYILNKYSYLFCSAKAYKHPIHLLKQIYKLMSTYPTLKHIPLLKIYVYNIAIISSFNWTFIIEQIILSLCNNHQLLRYNEHIFRLTTLTYFKFDSKPDLVNTKKHHDMYISIFILQLWDFEYYCRGSNELQCYLVMDLIEHFWNLIHVERHTETVTLFRWRHRWHHWKRLERFLFQLFSDNLEVVFGLLDIAG
jgi:hypothetical protein